ncbi:MAG: trypsin-like serine protease [Proteobacteria bacterium]|nr:MAG: trypsin-like serine protease [Pseudomonadota bacterium]
MKKVAGAVLGLAFVAQSCSDGKTVSSQKVVNGSMAFYFEQPAVVLLYDQSSDSTCTGTFLNDHQVLTAAHCTGSFDVDYDTGEVDGTMHVLFVDDLASGDARVFASSTSIYRNPNWDIAGSGVNSADLAIVNFPKGTWGTKAKISSRRAQVGDEVELFGYGINQDEDPSDSSSATVFRKGNNVIEQVGEGFIAFEGYSYDVSGDGSFASSGHGDSGGPLFVDGEIVGVVSGGLPPSYSGENSTNYYVDIHSEESEAFLSHVLDKR